MYSHLQHFHSHAVSMELLNLKKKSLLIGQPSISVATHSSWGARPKLISPSHCLSLSLFEKHKTKFYFYHMPSLWILTDPVETSTRLIINRLDSSKTTNPIQSEAQKAPLHPRTFTFRPFCFSLDPLCFPYPPTLFDPQESQ